MISTSTGGGGGGSGVTTSPPVLRFKEGAIVVPGDRLGTIRQVCSGKGTYIRGGHIYASLVGKLVIIMTKEESEQKQPRNNDENETMKLNNNDDDDNDYFRETVPSSTPSSSPSTPLFSCMVKETTTTTGMEAGPSSSLSSQRQQKRYKLPATSQVLQVGQLVVGTVLRITAQNAIVDIRAAQHVGALASYYEGAIQMEDIRKGATEQIILGECFRPGDIVVCRILSLGDARRYYLSTAETELGVVRAITSRGVPMIPISWKEMECPETGVKEFRKCAKPVHLTQQQQHDVNT
jgi:exosome complex RNA-binding protein Csl4